MEGSVLEQPVLQKKRQIKLAIKEQEKSQKTTKKLKIKPKKGRAK